MRPTQGGSFIFWGQAVNVKIAMVDNLRCRGISKYNITHNELFVDYLAKFGVHEPFFGQPCRLVSLSCVLWLVGDMPSVPKE